MLSLKTKYALRALLALARHEGEQPLQTGPLVVAAGAPRPYLEAILTELKRRGFVTSLRGRGGGFRLARPAEAISFADVIRAMDGPIALAPCASLTAYRPCADCQGETDCAIRRALIAAREASVAVLGAISLAEAAASPNRIETADQAA